MLNNSENVQPAAGVITKANGDTDRTMPAIRRVLIAMDASEPANWALEYGATIARQFGAQVALVHVIDTAVAPPPEGVFAPVVPIEDLRAEAVALLECAKGMLPHDVRPGTVILEGDPARGIVSAAEDWQADLVVLGAHARSRLARLILGSCVERVLREAPCPVLTVGHPVST